MSLNNNDSPKQKETPHEGPMRDQAIAQINEWASTFVPLENRLIAIAGERGGERALNKAEGRVAVEAARQMGGLSFSAGADPSAHTVNKAARVVAGTGALSRSQALNAEHADASAAQGNLIALGKGQQGMVRQSKLRSIETDISTQLAKQSADLTRAAGTSRAIGMVAGALGDRAMAQKKKPDFDTTVQAAQADTPEWGVNYRPAAAMEGGSLWGVA